MTETFAEALARKRRKADLYVTEPGRFRIDSLTVTMQSEHGNRFITFDNGNWSCTCDFFADHRICSHVMALEVILSESAGLHMSSKSEQG